MPVRRFANLDDMKKARWLAPGDPQIPGRLQAMWVLGASIVRVARPPGVHKFRTIEELAAFRASWPRELLTRPLSGPTEEQAPP